MNEIPNDISKRRLVWISSLTAAIFSVYFGSIFLNNVSFFGFQFRDRYLVLLVLSSVALAAWLCSKISSTHVSMATNVHVSVLTTLLLLIVVDVAYAIIQNAQQSSDVERETDPNYWMGEFSPRHYFPTRRDVMLYKPNITIKGSIFGDFYTADELHSPTLRNSVFERKTVAININRLGFREAEPIEHARIFALGDSFTAGWRVNVDKTWVKLLEHMLSVPIYNLGVDDASPEQELELVEYLLNADAPKIKIRHLLWMVFEGNDLEDTYAKMAPVKHLSFIRGTILATLKDLPVEIRNESFIAKMMRGEIQSRFVSVPHRYINGPLLFRSDRFGYKLFAPLEVYRAQRPMSYVVLHPNWPKLEDTFEKMGQIAQNFGFDVTVILAPTATRLQGKYFSGFPKISDKPYFLELVASLARKEKFEVVNLYDALRPFADQQLLYFRDDNHWNEDGHLLVARSLAQRLSILASLHPHS
jgi:hypothetical protein